MSSESNKNKFQVRDPIGHVRGLMGSRVVRMFHVRETRAYPAKCINQGLLMY